MEYVDPDGRPKMGNTACQQGHPLWLVSEGYAYCVAFTASEVYEDRFSAWRLTPPPDTGAFGIQWVPYPLYDGSKAWVTWVDYETLDDALEVIQTDMDTSTPVLTPAPTYSEWLATVS